MAKKIEINSYIKYKICHYKYKYIFIFKKFSYKQNLCLKCRFFNISHYLKYLRFNESNSRLNIISFNKVKNKYANKILLKIIAFII